jgi:hypothetical protein
VTVLADACACIDPADEEVALTYLERVAGVRVAKRSAPVEPVRAEL